MLNSLLIIAVAFLSLSHLILGIYSFNKNSRSKVTRMWFLVSFLIFFINGNLTLSLLTNSRDLALLFTRFIHIGVAFVPVVYLYFVILFLHKPVSKFKPFLFVGYLIGLIIALGSFSNVLIAGVSPKFGFDFWLDAGPFYPYILIYIFSYSLGGLYIMYRSLRVSDGVIKKKTLYIFLATLIAIIGTSTSYLPQTLGIYPFGNFITWLSPILITYGIFLDS